MRQCIVPINAVVEGQSFRCSQGRLWTRQANPEAYAYNVPNLVQIVNKDGEEGVIASGNMVTVEIEYV